MDGQQLASVSFKRDERHNRFTDDDQSQRYVLIGLTHGYRRILTVWRDTQPAPSVERVIGHWLAVLAEIEADTKAVLNILVSCK